MFFYSSIKLCQSNPHRFTYTDDWISARCILFFIEPIVDGCYIDSRFFESLYLDQPLFSINSKILCLTSICTISYISSGTTISLTCDRENIRGGKACYFSCVDTFFCYNIKNYLVFWKYIFQRRNSLWKHVVWPGIAPKVSLELCR